MRMGHTKVIKLRSREPAPSAISEAAEVLRSGGVVAFPTETVYGLGADAFAARAVEKVFEAKGRPSDNPLIVHISRYEHFEELAETIAPKGRILSEKFWPGPLTLVVKSSGIVPATVTAGLETVAVRMPDHGVALALISAFGRGIVGPSANLSGAPSATRAEHVQADLDGRIDLILDSGPTYIGVESTVVDVTAETPLILRLGGLIREHIEAAIGPVDVTSDDSLLSRSPGTRHRHYAPRAKVVLVGEENAEGFAELIETYHSQGKRVGCIVHSRGLKLRGSKTHLVDASENPARILFDALHRLDKIGVDVIIVEAVSEEGIGAAVMDRLRRATHDPRQFEVGV